MSTDYISKLESIRESAAKQESELVSSLKGELLMYLTKAERIHSALGSKTDGWWKLKPFQKVLNSLGLKAGTGGVTIKRKGKRAPMSAEAKAKISAAQKKRWEKKKTSIK